METLLQSATPTARLAALLAFLGAVLAVVLSVLVLARGLQGYRRSRDPGLPCLAAGIVLLSGGVVAVNLALTNVTGLDRSPIQVAANGTQLAGLVAVLAAIYRTRSPRGDDRDGSGDSGPTGRGGEA